MRHTGIIVIAMSERKFFNVRMITTTGILLAIEILVQILGNYIVIPGGFANLNFSLIIISIGAILYGPVVGGFLGLVSGVLTLFSPSTMSFFFSVSPVGTVLTCLLKTAVAGVAAGFLMKLFRKFDKELAGTIVVSILVPTINTGLFAIFCLLFFMDILKGINPTNIAGALFISLIGFNYIFEVLTTVIITPSLYKIMQHVSIYNRENKNF